MPKLPNHNAHLHTNKCMLDANKHVFFFYFLAINDEYISFWNFHYSICIILFLITLLFLVNSPYIYLCSYGLYGGQVLGHL